MRYLKILMVLAIAACQVQKKETVEEKPITEPAEPIVAIEETSVNACLWELCDSRLLISDGVPAIVCGNAAPAIDQAFINEVLGRLSELDHTTDFTFDYETEENLALGNHITQPYSSDLFVALDSAGGIFGTDFYPGWTPAAGSGCGTLIDGVSDGTICHWGTALYIAASPEILEELLGFNNSACGFSIPE